MSRKSAPLSMFLNFLKPFTLDIWLTVLGCLALACAAYAVLHRLGGIALGPLDAFKAMLMQSEQRPWQKLRNGGGNVRLCSQVRLWHPVPDPLGMSCTWRGLFSPTS